jgi:hypothetical protein
MGRYNGANQLVQVCRDASYAHRPDGLRHSRQTVGGQAATYLWDWTQTKMAQLPSGKPHRV